MPNLIVSFSKGVHGSPLGSEAIAEMKAASGFDPSVSFFVPDAIREFYKSVSGRNSVRYEEWKRLVSQVAAILSL